MSDQDDGDEAEKVGYGRPPRSTRFRKGRSGNPKGRPPGRRREIPYDNVLGQMVTIREDGAARQVTAAEAFLMKLLKTGLEGNGHAARQALAAIEQAKASRGLSDEEFVTQISLVFVKPGSVTPALEPLRMGRTLDRRREDRARVVLEPWIVEAALERLGARRLSEDEQRKVVDATRTPAKVKWPSWWKVKPKR